VKVYCNFDHLIDGEGCEVVAKFLIVHSVFSSVCRSYLCIISTTHANSNRAKAHFLKIDRNK